MVQLEFIKTFGFIFWEPGVSTKMLIPQVQCLTAYQQNEQCQCDGCSSDTECLNVDLLHYLKPLQQYIWIYDSVSTCVECYNSNR